LVVPKSIPIILPILLYLIFVCSFFMTLSQIVNLCANTKPSIKLSVYVKIDTILSDNMTFYCHNTS
jgi:hypothetical protein